MHIFLMADLKCYHTKSVQTLAIRNEWLDVPKIFVLFIQIGPLLGRYNDSKVIVMGVQGHLIAFRDRVTAAFMVSTSSK